MWQNSPVHLLYSGAQKLKSVGLIMVAGKAFKQRGHGGRPSYAAAITRVRLSDAWNRSSPQGRKDLYDFRKQHKRVDLVEYAHRGGDYLNCMTLGLFGLGQPNYELTLQEAIANQNE